jgi:hypothetical protein
MLPRQRLVLFLILLTALYGTLLSFLDLESRQPALNVPLLSPPGPSARPWADWSAPALFHAVLQGGRVEGAILVGKFAPHFSNYFEDATTWPVVRQCGKAHLCVREYTGGKCRWCAASPAGPAAAACVLGTLTASHSKEDRNMTFTRQTSLMAAKRSWAHPDSANAKPRYSTFWLQCDFQAGAGVVPGVAGVLTVEGLEGLSARVLPLADAKSATGESVVCTRGLFGELDGSQLHAFVDYYVNALGFHRVVAYGVGLDNNLQAHELVRPLIEAGKLVWVDLRDELQRVYGYLASDVLLFSHAVGQLPLKMDCLARARKLGAKWALHVDVDEMLVPGVAVMEGGGQTVARWPEFVRERNESWISFGVLDAKDLILCGNASFAGRWGEFWQSADRRLREVEWPSTTKRAPFRAMAKGCDPLTCNGAPGGRKVAIRVDRWDLHVPGIGVHEMRACALCQMDPPGWVVNAKDWYIRHVRGVCGWAGGRIDVAQMQNSCLNFAPPYPRGRAKERSEWFQNNPSGR